MDMVLYNANNILEYHKRRSGLSSAPLELDMGYDDNRDHRNIDP